MAVNIAIAELAGLTTATPITDRFSVLIGTEEVLVARMHGFGHDCLTWHLEDDTRYIPDDESVPPAYEIPQSQSLKTIPVWCGILDRARRDRLRLNFAAWQKSHERPFLEKDVALGWPLASVSTRIELVILSIPGSPRAVERFQNGYRVGSYDVKTDILTNGHVVAWCPVWGGIVFGGLFWSAMFAVTWVGLSTWRELARRRRGQCTRCGYDTRGLAICSECGTPAAPQSIPT